MKIKNFKIGLDKSYLLCYNKRGRERTLWLVTTNFLPGKIARAEVGHH